MGDSGCNYGDFSHLFGKVLSHVVDYASLADGPIDDDA